MNNYNIMAGITMAVAEAMQHVAESKVLGVVTGKIRSSKRSP